MPRVANSKVHRHSNGSLTPLRSTPQKIPLNDDMEEKAARMEARQALHDRQMNQIKAAVKTPLPPRRYDRALSNSPSTPRGSGRRGRDSDADRRRAVTPMKRMPILANFEEWMKMATDNKINANNSWNFALIDYFHDMSLLKEGDGVNFQKASCTLDGCVKIYTSRVDSVATETGKLLSGLADSRDRKARESGVEAEDADGNDEEGEDGGTRKSKKKAQRSHEATLAPSFSSLQLKRFELEFAVDPLFKKASADFDEGGAKGLLLNNLAIDGSGRIVFDSSDDAGDENSKDTDGSRQGSADPEQPRSPSPPSKEPSDNIFEDDTEIDVTLLASKFFPDLELVSQQDICPSLKDFELGDPSGSLDIPFLKAHENRKNEISNSEGGVTDPSGIMLDDDNAVGFDDDDDATLAGFDLGGEVNFGDGGEVWAREAALEPMLRTHRIDQDGGATNNGEGDLDNEDPYAISLSHQPANHENILSYFDNALQKNWAGPEHWKIRKIKEHAATTSTTAAPKQKKEKEPFDIDFAAPLETSVAELIYTQASSNSTISLPKTQWKTKGRNLLPDDKHFNSRQLLRLFIKPKARIGSKRRLGTKSSNYQRQDRTAGNDEMDEAFWANHKTEDHENPSDEGAAPGAYDANFFADDDGLAFPNGLGMADDDDDDNLPFADAREMLSPSADGAPGASADEAGGSSGLNALLNTMGAGAGSTDADGFGSKLVTQGGRRARPDYVAYARVAKKVDVRRLKQEMWKGMGDRLIESTDFGSVQDTGNTTNPQPQTNENIENATSTPMQINEDQEQASEPKEQESGGLRFTNIMNSLKSAYPKETLRDISTSYGFICLLHLANEKGLVLQGGESFNGGGSLEEIYIRKDNNAIIEEGAA